MSATDITYLNTPFHQKDEVKRLGARWDTVAKKWFVPAGMDTTPFSEWLMEVIDLPHSPTKIHDSVTVATQGIGLGELLLKITHAIHIAVPTAIWIKAEISHVRVFGGGHLAIELVEHDSQGNLTARVSSFLWKNVADDVSARFNAATGLDLHSGIKVMLLAKPDHHLSHGIRLTIQDIDPSYTLGDIEAKLRAIRTTLKQEGLLRRNQHLPAPKDFCCVAVISPDNAAGLGDFKQDADRLSEAGLCLFEYFVAKFQGVDAPLEISACLRKVYALQQEDAPYDAICIIRGGGSVTDLYWLNEVDLARVLCQSPIPVFTGIGHERDNTMLDEIAHSRFDTPSKVIAHIRESLCHQAREAEANYQHIMRSSMQQLSMAQHQIEQLATGIEPTVLRLLSESEVRADQSMQFIESKSHTTLLNAQAQLDQLNQRIISDIAQQLDRTTTHITQTYQSLLGNADNQLKQATQHVEALGKEILGVSPKATLQRGFAMIRSEEGIPISSVHQAKLQTSLTIEFRDGSLIAKPTKTPKRKNHE